MEYSDFSQGSIFAVVQYKHRHQSAAHEGSIP